jgi:catechol 2,3-dioxygenase-like lactoylglutathione lyase family enzyme
MAKLTYACVLTPAIERMAEFYRAVLHVEPEWTGTSYAEYATQPGIFCLWSLDAYAEIAGASSAPTIGTGGIMLEFEIDNVDAEFARLNQQLHLDFIIPPTTLPWGNRSIYFRDPDGNLVNLFSRAG